ncbi:MAG: sporulation protein [Clostridia bacterium]|nr:sporulation protein [Clostridia bacterium]
MPKKQRERNTPIRKRIADVVDISKDIILDASTLRITGTSELILENYKGITDYSDTKIVIRSNPKSIQICGTSLEIGTITDEMLYITGDFSDISFITQ